MSRLNGSDFHNLQSLKVSSLGPLGTPTRADEHLILRQGLMTPIGDKPEHLTPQRR